MAVERTVRIERYGGERPPDIAALREAAANEGFDFVDRLVDDWATGANRFSSDGEAFWIASIGDTPVGTCGLNHDPYLDDPGVARLRRLYVDTSQRRRGLARRLVQVCLDHAHSYFDVVRLRTPNEAADHFYDACGFARTSSDSATHELHLR